MKKASSPEGGCRAAAGGDSTKRVAGCVAEARPADDAARRSRDSGLLFARALLRPAAKTVYRNPEGLDQKLKKQNLMQKIPLT